MRWLERLKEPHAPRRDALAEARAAAGNGGRGAQPQPDTAS